MSFNGTEGKAINPTKAGEWTRSFREANPDSIEAHFFGRDILLALLAQADCQGIRFYYGLNNSVPQLIAVGADSEENDQLSESAIVADEALAAPPYRSQPNILNS